MRRSWLALKVVARGLPILRYFAGFFQAKSLILRVISAAGSTHNP
jgi:hypothetical protein